MPNQSTHNSTMNNPLQIQYNDPGNSVYLLYQKEVYNCDHSFLQSLMDWLYSSNESPFKFIVRNKALIKINRYGIIIQKENNAFNMNDESSNWTHIHFNLKHLKEIYVDKRHKDTCVLVSKVSPNSGSNYVWKKTNPSNYQSFRSPYGLNNAFKKSYLLTIIKFKDGPSKLLQTIQLLDSILADYNKQEEPKTTNNSVKPNEFDSNSTEKFGEDLANYYNSINMKNMKNLRVRPNVQQYFNDVFIKNQQQKFLNAMCNNQCTSESNNQLQCLQQSLAASQLNAAMQAACSINQLNQQQQQCMSMNGMTQQAQSSNFSELAAGHASLRNRILAARNNKRTLSIDNRHNSPLYANYNNSSNKSLQNYQMSNTNNSNNYFSIGGGGGIYGSSNSVNFSNLSRQGSVNEIRSPNNQVLIVNRNLVPGTGYLANTGYHQQQQHAISPNHFGSGFNSYLDLNQGGNTTTNGNTCNSPQLQAPLIEQCYQKAGGGPLSPFGFTPVGGLSTNNNTSNENLSEIGYQQYRKKYMNNLSVSSTSSLRNTLDIFSMKPSMMSQAKLHHMQHHHQMQQMHQKQNASICRQSELSGSITSMNSGYSNKLTNPLTTTTTNTPAKSASVTKKSSIGKGNAKNTESNKHDDSDKSKKKRTQANENMSQSNEVFTYYSYN